MKQILNIDNLNYQKVDKKIIENLSFSVSEKEWFTIAGISGSGKTAILKLILGIYKGKNKISVDGLSLNYNNLKKIRRKIGICFQEPHFKYKKVFTEIKTPLVKLGYKKSIINDLTKSMCQILKLPKKKIVDLSNSEKKKLQLAKALIFKPKLLVLDDTLLYFDKELKLELVKLIKIIQLETGMAVLSLTSDLENINYGKRTIILDNGKQVMTGFSKNVLKDTTILSKIGFELPFMVDLSSKLKLYNLINDTFYEEKVLVSELW